MSNDHEVVVSFGDLCGAAAVFSPCRTYAYRSTDPLVLGTVDDPVGPENDHHLQACAAKAAVVVAAWGAFPHGKPYERAVAEMLDRDLQCLGTTKGGHPRHPLYVRGDTPLVRWTEPGAQRSAAEASS